MTVLAVLPFRAAQGEGAALDPDAHDLARWLAAETAGAKPGSALTMVTASASPSWRKRSATGPKSACASDTETGADMVCGAACSRACATVSTSVAKSMRSAGAKLGAAAGTDGSACTTGAGASIGAADEAGVMSGAFGNSSPACTSRRSVGAAAPVKVRARAGVAGCHGEASGTAGVSAAAAAAAGSATLIATAD